jgi:hypothetical protein
MAFAIRLQRILAIALRIVCAAMGFVDQEKIIVTAHKIASRRKYAAMALLNLGNNVMITMLMLEMGAAQHAQLSQDILVLENQVFVQFYRLAAMGLKKVVSNVMEQTLEGKAAWAWVMIMVH